LIFLIPNIPVADRLVSFLLCLAPFTMYQKPVIDHYPWPSSQFNKWHAQNKLISSSLIVIGSSPWFTPPQTSDPLSPQGLFVFY
jgi:hypothetical protein